MTDKQIESKRKVKVTVLMSTYNGGKYLREQIESILNQKEVLISLYVRDDGSTDDTVNILNEYQEKGKLEYFIGENRGAAYSFWDLLLHAQEDSYYAFSDQDDFWMEKKLISAIENIRIDEKTPFLYFSRKTIVDKNLIPMKMTDEPVRGVDLRFSMLKGFASGCTMVFNRKLYEKLTIYTPEVMTMHDSWILKVAGAVGKVYYDSNSYILYRQHGKNVIGNNSRKNAFNRHIKKIFKYKDDNITSKMAKQLITNYGNQMQEMDVRYIKYLSDIRESVSSRYRLIFSNYYKTQVPWNIILFKIFFALGWM